MNILNTGKFFMIFMIFIILSSIFTITFPLNLYPDYLSSQYSYNDTVWAVFLKSNSLLFDNKVSDTFLIFDYQLYLTPQIQILNIFSKIIPFSGYENCQIISVFDKLQFLFITILFITLLILIDNCIKNKSNKSNKSNLIFVSSLFFPITLTSITIPSAEAIYSIIIMFIFSRVFDKNISLGNYLFLLCLLIYAYFLDSRNWIVSFLFLLNIIIMKILIEFNKKLFFIIFTIIVFGIIFFSNEFINLLDTVYQSNKLKSVLYDIEQNGADKKNLFDLISRYLYFWLTLAGILTSNKMFMILNFLYIISGFCFVIHIIVKKKVIINNIINNNIYIIIILNIIFFPLIIISLLPLHAFGKYYIFMIPLILSFLSFYIEIRKLLLFIVLSSIIFMLNVQFFYIKI